VGQTSVGQYVQEFRVLAFVFVERRYTAAVYKSGPKYACFDENKTEQKPVLFTAGGKK